MPVEHTSVWWDSWQLYFATNVSVVGQLAAVFCDDINVTLIQPHLMLIGVNLKSPMEDSECSDISICRKCEDPIAAPLSTPSVCTAWR
jgi:hypothetical protein